MQTLSLFKTIMFIIVGICMVISAALFIITIYWLWFKQENIKSKINPKLKCANICCMLVSIGCCVSVFMLLYHAFTNNILIFDPLNKSIFTFVDLFAFLCKIILYIVLALRLSITFNDSYLKVENKWFILLSSQYLISTVCFCGILYKVINDSGYENLVKFVRPFVIILSINETAILCFHLYLFNSRLWMFVMNMNDNDNHQINDKQQRLLQVIVRLNVLSFIAIIFTALMYFCIFAAILFIGHTNETENWWIAFRMMQAFVGCVDSLTIFLNLKFSKHIYNKICKCCDTLCYRMCLKCKSMDHKGSEHQHDYIQMKNQPL
eukprot:64913_1